MLRKRDLPFVDVLTVLATAISKLEISYEANNAEINRSRLNKVQGKRLSW